MRCSWTTILAFTAFFACWEPRARGDWLVGIETPPEISGGIDGVVAHYDASGNFVRVIDQGLDTAGDIKIGPDGKIYVGDASGGSGRILRYSANGTPEGVFASGIRAVRMAFGRDLDDDGSQDIYVNTGSNATIEVVSGADGSILGTLFDDSANVLDPYAGGGIVFGPDVNGDQQDDLWVSDERNNRGIRIFDGANGTELYPDFIINDIFADALTVGPDGRVYGTEPNRNVVVAYSTAGTRTEIAQAQTAQGNKMFGRDLAFDPTDDSLLVSTRFDETNDFNGVVWSFSSPGYSDNPTPAFLSEASIANQFLGGNLADVRSIAYYVPPAGLEGDHNGDGTVDAADYVLWRKDPSSYGGDPQGYTDWVSNFGATFGTGSSGSSAATVPEPGVLAISLTGLLIFGACRHRRALRKFLAEPTI